MNTKKRVSRKNSTHRRGRAFGLNRWYSLPLDRIEIESQVTAIPNEIRRAKTMSVPVCESIVGSLYQQMYYNLRQRDGLPSCVSFRSRLRWFLL